MPETRKVDLRLDPELAPEIALHFAELQALRAPLERCVAGMSVEDLDWTPAAGMNSVGTLLLHSAAVELSWLREEVLGEEFPAAAVELRRHRDAMLGPGGLPPSRGLPLEFYLDQLSAVRASTRATLAGFSDQDLASFHRDAGTGNAEFSLRWILYHLVEHMAHHAGQIGLLRHLRRAQLPGGAAQARA